MSSKQRESMPKYKAIDIFYKGDKSPVTFTFGRYLLNKDYDCLLILPDSNPFKSICINTREVERFDIEEVEQ